MLYTQDGCVSIYLVVEVKAAEAKISWFYSLVLFSLLKYWIILLFHATW